MKLLDTLKVILTEAASQEDIVKAINQKQVASIYYNGDEPGGKGLREIEPVALGRSKAGNMVLRAWDELGASHTAYLNDPHSPKPGWRLFRVDKITMFKPLRKNFTKPRPGYNFNGDKDMVSIITLAKFDTTQTQS